MILKNTGKGNIAFQQTWSLYYNGACCFHIAIVKPAF